MKKYMSVIMATILLMSFCMFFSVSVSAVAKATPGLGETSGFFSYELLANGEAQITEYNGSEAEVSIPSVLDGHKVTRIGERSFQHCESLKKVFIPACITQIDEAPFRYCDALVAITVDENNPVFDSRDDCQAIIETETDTLIAGCKTTVIPDTVKAIGSSAFFCCSSLTEIVIPKGVTHIGGAAFSRCIALKNIMLPDTIIQIGGFAFYGCTSLESIDIPDSVTNMGDYNTFYGCTSLKVIRIPSGVKKIGNGIFSHCTALTYAELPDTVIEIGPDAFLSCNSLLSVKIPKTVTSIGNRSFGYEQKMGDMIGSPIPDFTIYGYPGSTAETYARENEFTFIPLNEETKIGDADGDGQVDLTDVTEIQHLLSSMKTNADEETMMVADVDKNGVLEIIDATWIQRYLAGMEIPYTVG